MLLVVASTICPPAEASRAELVELLQWLRLDRIEGLAATPADDRRSCLAAGDSGFIATGSATAAVRRACEEGFATKICLVHGGAAMAIVMQGEDQAEDVELRCFRRSP